MAVTLINTPKELYAVYNKIPFIFNISDLGTAPTKRYIAYKLQTGAGVDITELEIIRPPNTSVNASVDISRSLQGLVNTLIPKAVPDFSTSVAIEDPLIIDDFKLLWGEYTINTDTGVEVISIESEINFSVINAALQPYELDFFDAGLLGLYALGLAPRSLDVHRGHYEFLWVMGASNVRLSYKFPNPVDNLFVDYALTGNVASVPLMITEAMFLQLSTSGTRNYRDIQAIESTITFGANTMTFRRNITCEPSETTSYKTVEFLCPKGGRGCISFAVVSGIVSGSSFNRIDGYLDYDVVENGEDHSLPNTVGGNTVTDNKATKVITLLAEAPNNLQSAEYFANFAASTEYYIIEDVNILDTSSATPFQTVTVKKKLIKRSATATVYSERGLNAITLSFSGEIGNEINTQTQSR